MKIFNRVCSVILIFTISAFIISVSQNLIFRTAGVYGFYFNDSRAVDSIYTTLSNSEMADEIASFMRSWMPEKFEVLEDTGYDMESVFTEEDSDIMMTVKKALDISGIICIVSLIVSAAIYTHLLQQEKKKSLANSYKVSFVLTLAMAAGETVIMVTNSGRAKAAELLNLVNLPEESQLMEILSADFIQMSAFFVAGFTMIVLAFVTYVTIVVTKPPRMFY